MLRVRVLAIAAMGVSGVLLAGPSGATSSPLSLSLPGSTAFAILGYDCGSITQYDYASQFDPTSGYPDGNAYLSTSCSAGGRGGHSVTYTAWVSATWDFTGAVVSYTALTGAPTVDPTLSVTDGHGNVLANQSNEALLTLAPGFVPAPRLTGVSPTAEPQGSTVTITGTGFTGATGVSFGGTAAASFAVTGDTSVSAVVPAVRHGTVDVTVTGPGGTSAVTPADQFTFTLTPRVASVAPSTGSADGGTKVVIRGVNLNGATRVSFGGIPATHVKVVGDSKITALSPAVADPVVADVTVTNSYGTSALTPADRFTYVN